MAVFTILAAIGGAVTSAASAVGAAGSAIGAAAAAQPLAAAALGTTLVSGGFSAAASRSAGEDRKNQLERQAEQERIAATGRELQRREELTVCFPRGLLLCLRLGLLVRVRLKVLPSPLLKRLVWVRGWRA